MILVINIPGEPKPKQSARFCRAGNTIRSYQKSSVKATEAMIKQMVKLQLPDDFEIITGPVYVRKLHYKFTPIKSMKKADKERLDRFEVVYKTTKPDLTDNLSKGLFDALEGIVYKNDSQICAMDKIRKFYSNRPGIYLELEY